MVKKLNNQQEQQVTPREEFIFSCENNRKSVFILYLCRTQAKINLDGVVKSPIYCVVGFFQTLGILHV